jgi:hypothetical protein
MVEKEGLIEGLQVWVAANKAPLSAELIDISLVVPDNEAAIAAAVLYAETQSPDLYDDDADTTGYVDLVGRLTITHEGTIELEVLESDSAETIHEEQLPQIGQAELEGVIESFLVHLRQRPSDG